MINKFFGRKYQSGVIFSFLAPHTTDNWYMLLMWVALNNSVDLIWHYHWLFWAKMPIWCDFQLSSTPYYWELVNVAPLDVHTRNRPKSTDVQEQKKLGSRGLGNLKLIWELRETYHYTPKLRNPRVSQINPHFWYVKCEISWIWPKSTDVQVQNNIWSRGLGDLQMTWGVAGDITLFPKIEKPLGLSDPSTLWALLMVNCENMPISPYSGGLIFRFLVST